MAYMILLLTLFPIIIETTTASLIPGMPGAVWSEDEVNIVREKVKEMIVYKNWRGDGIFQTDGTFSTDGSTPFSNEDKYCPDCPAQRSDSSKGQIPTGSKLLRLSFHDCIPYTDDEGNLFGGCDGCLNWAGMGFGYAGSGEGFDYHPVNKGDNNGMQTTVAALEMIYKNVSWPSTAPPLNKSLWETGKSRADLWQFAGRVALEMEIERANFACDYDYNAGNQVKLLESEERCYFKLFKPSVLKFGRVDCIPDEAKKVTPFPYEATDTESHPNVYGSAKSVINYMKDNFQLSAREGISLMAVHATYGQQHNYRIPASYKWPGNPYLTNMYFKYLAGTGVYRRMNGLSPHFPTSVGDSEGRPMMGNLWRVGCGKLWRSNMTENGWGGPCIWRPTNSGCNRPNEETTKMCFDHFAEDGSIVMKSGGLDPKHECQDVTFDAQRIQYEAEPHTSGNQTCAGELTFALTYEVNFMNEFQLDEEFRPHGCNGSLDNMLFDKADGESTVNCPPNMEKFENGEALSEITKTFAENHDIWNEIFISSWDKMIVNGYEDDQLVEGPEYSWLGYSFFEGSYENVTFPFIFTDNKKANPTSATFESPKLRDRCLRIKTQWDKPGQCPPEFKRDHEDFFISILESPWSCEEEGSTLDSIPINLRNAKDGKMLQINEDSSVLEVDDPSDDPYDREYQKWTYKPACDGGVVLTNVAAFQQREWVYDSKEMTLRNENGFAYSTKHGLRWAHEVSYFPGTKKPWLYFQWQVIRAQNN